MLINKDELSANIRSRVPLKIVKSNSHGLITLTNMKSYLCHIQHILKPLTFNDMFLIYKQKWNYEELT